MKICKSRAKKFYNIGPWRRCYKTFFVIDKLERFSSPSVGAYPSCVTIYNPKKHTSCLSKLKKTCHGQTLQLILLHHEQ
jgi:hypothetical protein